MTGTIAALIVAAFFAAPVDSHYAPAPLPDVRLAPTTFCQPTPRLAHGCPARCSADFTRCLSNCPGFAWACFDRCGAACQVCRAACEE